MMADIIVVLEVEDTVNGKITEGYKENIKNKVGNRNYLQKS